MSARTPKAAAAFKSPCGRGARNNHQLAGKGETPASGAGAVGARRRRPLTHQQQPHLAATPGGAPEARPPSPSLSRGTLQAAGWLAHWNLQPGKAARASSRECLFSSYLGRAAGGAGRGLEARVGRPCRPPPTPHARLPTCPPAPTVTRARTCVTHAQPAWPTCALPSHSLLQIIVLQLTCIP